MSDFKSAYTVKRPSYLDNEDLNEGEEDQVNSVLYSTYHTLGD